MLGQVLYAKAGLIMDYEFHAMRIQMSLTPAERTAIGAAPNHNAAVEICVQERADRGNVKTIGTFFYSWEQGALTTAQILEAIRTQAAVIRDATIVAEAPSTPDGLVGVRFPV